jgi:hypothetical protein
LLSFSFQPPCSSSCFSLAYLPLRNLVDMLSATFLAALCTGAPAMTQKVAQDLGLLVRLIAPI